MNLELNGRVAMVLGATSGIGAAIAESLASEGVRVIVAGRNAKRAQAVAERIGNGALALTVDLRNRDCVRNFVYRVDETEDRIDILVLNGGGPPSSLTRDVNLGSLASASADVLDGQITITNAFIARMAANTWGRVVAIGSRGVVAPIHGLTLSNMTRSAMAAFIKDLSREYADMGVTASMIVPGQIETPRARQLAEANATRKNVSVDAYIAEAIEKIPMRRFGQPDEVASLVTFLASEKASYITGAFYRVDGGSLNCM